MDGKVKLNKLLDKLKQKDFKLQSLLEVTQAINHNLQVEKLWEIFEYILRQQLGIYKAILFTYDSNKWECTIKYGHEGGLTDIDVSRDLLHIQDITVMDSSSKDSLLSFDLVIPVHHKEIPLAYLLIGDLNEDEIRISPTIKHMPFIQTLTNIIVVAAENKRMAKESIRQERVKKELELASEMQALLFPKNLPSNERIDVAAHYVPQHMVGGDYYDFFQINPNEVMFCMADVSGKGVSAAMLMANFQANLRAMIKYTDYALQTLVEELNQKVMDSAEGEKFITFFIARYNIKSRKLQYINAGHNFPVLTNGQEHKMLNVGCTGLGMFDELPFINKEELILDSNAVIVCYTDGVVELQNAQDEEFGTERLGQLIHENFNASMETLNQNIFESLISFKSDRPYYDDTALFSVRFV